MRKADFSLKKHFKKVTPKNKKTILLGNSPSANKDIERVLKDKNTLSKTNIWVVNMFAFSEYFWVLKPHFYVFVDPYLWEQEPIDERLNRLLNILSEVTWVITVYIPFIARKKNGLVETLDSFENIRIIFFNNIPLYKMHKSLKYIMLKKGLGNLGAQNVLIAALFLIIFTGSKNVVLYGAEMSWIKNLFLTEDMKWYLINEHCYKEKGDIQAWNFRNTNESPYVTTLKILLRIYEQFAEIKKYAEVKGVKIYNDTPNTSIDIFPRSKKFNAQNQ